MHEVPIALARGATGVDWDPGGQAVQALGDTLETWRQRLRS